MTITGLQYIGYSTSRKGNQPFSGPGAQTEPAVLFYEATAEEIEEAVQKGNAAFRSYRLISGAGRAYFLEQIAEAIEENRSLLIALAVKETGLAPARLEGEVTRTVNQIRLFAGLLKEGSWVKAIIDTADASRRPLPKPDIRQLQQPIGAVGIFGASNFPFAFSVAGGDTISALAAGCPVVYKAHPGHPALSEMTGALIVEAAKKCKMPEGVFSLIQGASHTAGQLLVNHALIHAIAFTGSFRGGKALFDAAAKRPSPIPVFAEMGSVNPVFLLPGILRANGKEIAIALAHSNTSSAGQFCTNPGILIASDSSERTLFIEQFARSIEAAAGSPMLTEAIFQQYHQGIQALSGRQEITLMTRAKGNNPGEAYAHMFEASADAFLADSGLWDEIFGPESIHIRANKESDMIKLAESLPGQLTVSIWGTPDDLLSRQDLIRVLELKAGRIIINGVPTGVEVCPAMMHGGPFPATTDNKYTSVGSQSIYRFTRPVCYQDFPAGLLPEAVRDENPLQIWRMVNGAYANGIVNNQLKSA